MARVRTLKQIHAEGDVTTVKCPVCKLLIVINSDPDNWHRANGGIEISPNGDLTPSWLVCMNDKCDWAGDARVTVNPI